MSQNNGRPQRRRPLDPMGGMILGLGLAIVLFGNLMVPSYGAADIAAQAGVPTWSVSLLATVCNFAVALACLCLAAGGWVLGRRGIVTLWLLASGALAVPALLPPARGASVVMIVGAFLLFYALAAAMSHFSAQVDVVDRAPQNQKSEVIGRYLRYHLVFGVALGGVPFFFGWRAGEITLAASAGMLALGVAFFWRNPPMEHRGSWRSPVRLLRDTGAGVAVLSIGQVGWTAAYLIPGLFGLPAALIAVYATVAQLAAAVVVPLSASLVDRDRTRAAVVTAILLVVSIAGVAIFPALAPRPFLGATVGQYIAGLFFALDEIAANIFLTAIEGLLSLESWRQRSQLVGQACKFGAVGAGGLLLAATTAVLGTLGLNSAEVGVGVGVALALTLAASFALTLPRLHARNRQV